MFSEDHYYHLRLHMLFFFNLVKSLSQKLLRIEAISTFIILYYFLNNLSVTVTSEHHFLMSMKLKSMHVRSCCTTIIRTKEFHNTLQCKINTWNSGFAYPKPLKLNGKKLKRTFNVQPHYIWRHGEKDIEEGYKKNKIA